MAHSRKMSRVSRARMRIEDVAVVQNAGAWNVCWLPLASSSSTTTTTNNNTKKNGSSSYTSSSCTSSSSCTIPHIDVNYTTPFYIISLGKYEPFFSSMSSSDDDKSSPHNFQFDLGISKTKKGHTLTVAHSKNTKPT